MPKEILLITNYFPPEKGAAANRMFFLAESLAKAEYTVKVVCPIPNYPSGKILKGFESKIHTSEKMSFGSVTRLWIWPTKSPNKFLRLLSMISFSISLIFYFLFTKIPKMIFIQYSPIFVGFTAVSLGRLFSRKIFLNVSDLWPSAGLEMGILNKGLYYLLLEKMETFCYRSADLIIGQSQEILDHIKQRTEIKNQFLYRNIPDFKITDVKQRDDPKDFKLVYAGLLGVAQGIPEICSRLNFPENVSFHIYGNGPDAERIKVLQKQNIHFHGELTSEALHSELQKYDIAFVPLINRIYGSVPSKIYEYSRLGLPILYFAGGEGGKIVEKVQLGWVIPVGEFKSLQNFIDSLSEKELERFPKELVQANSVSAFNFTQQFKGLLKAMEE